ncbi:MAG: methyltransferase domain-containing protein [Rickettsiales bacterium]|nr:methyltransferase domain-containing protein [Rickettsiales bacterium]
MKLFRKKSLNRIAKENRKKISYKYIKGEGIEIGALHTSMPISKNAKTKFVDRLSYEDYLKQYPELKGKKLIKPDIVSNAETLEKVRNESQDYIIACHVLEHFENPILAINNFYRVLKNGGIAYIIVPDKNFCFDKNRELTKFEDIVSDYQNGGKTSRKEHYRDWLLNVENLTDEKEIAKKIEEMDKSDFNIHFHVWDNTSFLKFLISSFDLLKIKLNIIHYEFNNTESIAILKKL